jgi:hypothetical protein
MLSVTGLLRSVQFCFVGAGDSELISVFVITILLHNYGDFVMHIESEILVIDACRSWVIP